MLGIPLELLEREQERQTLTEFVWSSRDAQAKEEAAVMRELRVLMRLARGRWRASHQFPGRASPRGLARKPSCDGML